MKNKENINKEIKKACHAERLLLSISRFLHKIKENALLIKTRKREALKQVQGEHNLIIASTPSPLEGEGACKAGEGEQIRKSFFYPPLIRALPTFSLQGRRDSCCSRGFTLIELLVVVLIIGILAAVALPQYEKAVWKSRFTQAKLIAKSISDAQELYYLANGSYSADATQLSINVPATSCNNEVCYFPWGYCNIRTGEYGLVACDLQKNGSDFIRYEHWLDHSAWARTTTCVAYSTDLNNVTNQICKAETRNSTPGTQTNRVLWGY